MSTITNIPRTTAVNKPGNGADIPTFAPPKIRLTADCQTSHSNIILPAGSEGTVIDYAFRGRVINDLVITFPGIAPVVTLPADSDLIAFIGEVRS